MGLSISAVLAKMYVEDCEKKGLQTFEASPRVWWYYVAAAFVIVKRDRLQPFPDHRDQTDRMIQFPLETEPRGVELPLVDCSVNRIGGRLKTTVYRKATDGNKVLGFSSSHGKTVWINVACSMLHGAKQLCTDEVDQKWRLTEAFNRLVQNGSRKRLIKRQLDQVLNPQPELQR